MATDHQARRGAHFAGGDAADFGPASSDSRPSAYDVESDAQDVRQPSGYEPSHYQEPDYTGPINLDDYAPLGNHDIADDLPTIGVGQGAKVTTRENASEAADRARANAEERHRKRHEGERSTSRRPSAHDAQAVGKDPGAAGPRRSKRNMAAVIGGTLAVLVVLAVVLRFVVAQISPGPAEQAAQIESEQEAAESEDTGEAEVQATSEDTLAYGSFTYTLELQEDGNYALVRTDESGNASALFEVEGTPAAFILYNSVIVIPEDLDEGWDVIAYVAVDGSVASNVVDSDGNAVGGSGQIESVTLDGSVVTVIDSTGTTTDVSLE